jgi:mannose-6-phosphate isomerase
MDPIALPSNQPADRFYLGGHRISEFRGEVDSGPRTPEDWVASTTTVRGTDVGLTRLPDGSLLRDAIAGAPVEWLGADHVGAFGADTKLLVKLLDPGQRLPVHAHPGVAFASVHLGATHGKAEAWYILAAGEVYLGLTRDVPFDELAALVEAQDIERMLGLMHRVEVAPGDTVYVPPGVLHAIGEGVLLAEVQEPEDLSILLEWRDFELDGLRDGHLGIGFDTALQAVEIRGRSADEVAGLIVRGAGDGSALVPAADEFFRLDRVVVDGSRELEAGFAVLLVLGGELRLGTLALTRGSTVLVPHAAGPLLVQGTGELLAARPPAAPAGIA